MPVTLLFGHDGQVGWELERRLSSFGPVRGFSYPQVDFGNIDSIRKLVRDIRPGLLINAAAYTAVDLAESQQEAARAVNATAPGVLAEEARALDIPFVHYSTDFVFDGRKKSPYTENDAPNPLNVYGRTKLEGEEAVKAAGGKYFIFRLSWVYGMRGKNFLLTMQRLARERGNVSVVDDQVGCPTWCASAAQATVEVVKKIMGDGAVMEADDVSGLYHMVCSGQTSWYGFAKAILGDAFSVKPVATSEYPTPARRPAFSVMNCSLLKKTFGIEMPPWETALAECMEGDK